MLPVAGDVPGRPVPAQHRRQVERWTRRRLRPYADERDSDIGFTLQRDGYRTGFIGKYINGYRAGRKARSEGSSPGCSREVGTSGPSAGAYGEWHYTQVESVDGQPPPGQNIVRYEGETEADYYTDFVQARALEFLDRADDEPFALFVNTYASHSGVGSDDPDHEYNPRFPPAPRDRKRTGTEPADWDTAEFRHGDCGGGPGGHGGCRDITTPDPMWTESFDQVGTNPPDWRADLEPLSPRQLKVTTALTRQRAQSLQAVSDLIDAVRAALGADIANTYLVFTSDNGYFLGQHRLWHGKGTAYDHDVRVPLVIVPPGGLDQPRTVTEVVQNVDLAPTFADIADARLALPTDGMSLLPWLGAPEDLPTTWRDGGLVIFRGGDNRLGPDGSRGSRMIPAYKALRTKRYLYIDNGKVNETPPPDHGKGEFYVVATDPEQMDNLYDDLAPRQRRDLHDALVEYASCSGRAGPNRCQEVDLPEIILESGE